jgi:hypothetical protein
MNRAPNGTRRGKVDLHGSAEWEGSCLKLGKPASGPLTSDFTLYTSNFRRLAVRPTDKKLGTVAKSGVFVNFSS